MKTNYVLIDFENVQPGNMDSVRDGFKIKVFVGAKQKISVEVATAVQAFGTDAEYIQVDGGGKNALDFHIAYYIGRLAAEMDDSQFFIVSKDTGFDPLIQHLKRRKISCRRVSSVADIQSAAQGSSKKPAAVENKKGDAGKTPGLGSLSDMMEAVVARLGKGPAPRTEKTLRNFIKTTFPGRPDGEYVDDIVRQLQERKIIAIREGRVDYAPGSQARPSHG